MNGHDTGPFIVGLLVSIVEQKVLKVVAPVRWRRARWLLQVCIKPGRGQTSPSTYESASSRLLYGSGAVIFHRVLRRCWCVAADRT